MKTLKFIAIAGFVAIMSVSCQEKPPVEEGENSQASAELVSFGFYLEDNADLIDKDYIASSLSQETVIRIPDGGSGKTLVARLEVGENDEALVNGESPVDGKISVDATYPIDVVVTDSESGLSSAYVIKVGKILGAEMVPITVYNEANTDLAGNIDMKVNPSDGAPYIVYLRSATDKENQLSVIKWNGTAFDPVGKLGFTETASGERVRIPAINFDNNGNPIVAARYDGNPDSEMSIYSYSGTWNMLGYTSEEANSSAEPTVFVNPISNYPVVCYYGNNAYKRQMVVSEYNGSSMSTATPMSPAPTVDGSVGAYGRSRAVTVDNTVYVLTAFNQAGYWLYKYENNSWSSIIESYMSVNSHYGCIAMKADGAGNLYAMFADNSSGENYNVQLYKIDVENKSFTPVGNVIASCTARGTVYFDFGINPVSGQIVVVFRGDTVTLTDKGIYFGYIESTGLWSDFVKVGNYTETDDDMYVDYAPDGKGYAAVSTEEGLAFFGIQTEEDVLPE